MNRNCYSLISILAFVGSSLFAGDYADIDEQKLQRDRQENRVQRTRVNRELVLNHRRSIHEGLVRVIQDPADPETVRVQVSVPRSNSASVHLP